MVSVGSAVPSVGNQDWSGVTPLTSYVSARAADDRPAFTFVDYSTDRSGVKNTVSWRELNRRARAVAVKLSQVTDRGARVAVLAPQDLNYVVAFLGSLYAGVIAVPLFAPEVSLHGERLIGALADCDAEIWLTSESALSQVHGLRDGSPVPRPKQIIAVDQLADALADEFVEVPVAMTEPAYLQYTSGSTSEPSGAIITHGNVVANARQIMAGYGIGSGNTATGWIPFFHDMGLLLLLVTPVVAGMHTVFTTPFAFIQKPLRWLQLLAGHPNTITAAPNFAFEYAASRIPAEARAALDLSGVRTLINGSEPVRAGTVAKFAEAFGPSGLNPMAHRPSYGLAEATVFVSATPDTGARIVAFDREELNAGKVVTVSPQDPKAVQLVSAGRVIGQHVQLVDQDTRRVRPDGQVGEVWVHGPNTAVGYWQKPERSEETFNGQLVDKPHGVPGDRWLRTGDLGVRYDGELFITGRIKDLIIIDGKNHYPQDLEVTAQNSHAAIRRDHVAAFSVQGAETEGVVVVAEFSRHVEEPDRDPEEIGKAVRSAIAAHHDVRLLDFVLVRPGQVRRTSSGKIARSATRQAYLDGTYAQEAPSE